MLLHTGIHRHTTVMQTPSRVMRIVCCARIQRPYTVCGAMHASLVCSATVRCLHRIFLCMYVCLAAGATAPLPHAPKRIGCRFVHMRTARCCADPYTRYGVQLCGGRIPGTCFWSYWFMVDTFTFFGIFVCFTLFWAIPVLCDRVSH
jgi:hypothetical protein